MADNSKRSFILYNSYAPVFLEELNNEQAGELIKQIFSYVANGEEIKIEDIAVRVMWRQIKDNLDRDMSKWEEIRQKRSEAGKKSAESRSGKKESPFD